MGSYNPDFDSILHNGTCKVDAMDAKRFASERVNGNRCAMVCPRWNGKDLYGRPVCRSSQFLQVAGCTDPMTAVMRENSHRPKIMDVLYTERNMLNENYEQKLARANNYSGTQFETRCKKTV